MTDFNINKTDINTNIKPDNPDNPNNKEGSSIYKHSIFSMYDTDTDNVLSDEEIKLLAEDYSKSDNKNFKTQVESFISQAKQFASEIATKFEKFIEQITSKITTNKTEEKMTANNLRNTTTTKTDDKTTTTVITRTDKNGKVISEQTRIETQNDDGTTSVQFTEKRNSKTYYKTKFKYSREKLGDFIIEHSKGEKFSNIKKILSKDKESLTAKEQNLLNDYNNLLDSAIATGTDYGVDPNLILTIILREVKFNGSKVGRNGNGYMQLTSDPINEMCGTTAKEIKTTVYGNEVAELLEESEFNINTKNQTALANKVTTKIRNNKDWDFNIRLGTLYLRRFLRKYGKNVEMAAIKYNSSPGKIAYGSFVNTTYSELLKKYT